MKEQKETVLVTGSSGRIGYLLAKRLADSFNVVGFDRYAPSHPPPSAECLYVDITSDKSLRRGLEAVREMHGNRLASVIHLAAYYDFSGVPSHLYDDVTVRGTERLLGMLQDFEVEQFIFSSTNLVHAPSAPGKRINEDSQLDPKWPYPQSKVAAEEVVHAKRGKIPVVILRIAGMYDDLCNSAPIAQQIQRIYEHDFTAYLFPGDVAAGCQAFVHNDDLIDSILLAVTRREELSPEVTLLIGEPESLNYDDLQRILGKLIHNVAWKTWPIPSWLIKAGAWVQEILPLGRSTLIKPWMVDFADDNMELDITRAHTILGWEPRHSLRDTLPKMIPPLLADPLTWYHENELKPPLWLQEAAPSVDQATSSRRPFGKEIEHHELMKLGKELGHEISMPASTASPEPAEQEKGPEHVHA